MEYGGSVLNKRLGRGDRKGNIRKTSDAFQLATAVLFQSPVQNFALTPEAYTSAPTEAIAFMKEVPTTWDETRYIDGYPGKYAVIARRHGNTWYIAGVSALDDKTDLYLDMPMLSKDREIVIYSDSEMEGFKTANTKVKEPAKLKISLEPGHGFVIVTK